MSSIFGKDKPLSHYLNNPTEDVNYIENRGGNPYSNTYNPDWRDHPNLRWGGNQGEFPKYAKHLKKIMSKRRKIKIGEQVNIDASCSAIISKHIPPKLKDPRSFTILVEIGDIHFKLKNTQITLQLANRSLVQPEGVLEYVLVKVRNFIILADFDILNFKEDRAHSVG
ncbi:hypothetical protein V6Z11_A07G201400 [Gossypium hirsutum]